MATAETGYSEGGPECEIEKLNREPGEQPLRVECEFWTARTKSTESERQEEERDGK